MQHCVSLKRTQTYECSHNGSLSQNIQFKRKSVINVSVKVFINQNDSSQQPAASNCMHSSNTQRKIVG